jgi:hypothetical protein
MILQKDTNATNSTRLLISGGCMFKVHAGLTIVRNGSTQIEAYCQELGA